MLLVFLLFLTGGGLILFGVIGGIAIMFGVSLPFTGLVAVAMFITGGCLEGAAVYIFCTHGPSAMMNTMESIIDKNFDKLGKL
jgi:hypothetical protein